MGNTITVETTLNDQVAREALDHHERRLDAQANAGADLGRRFRNLEERVEERLKNGSAFMAATEQRLVAQANANASNAQEINFLQSRVRALEEINGQREKAEQPKDWHRFEARDDAEPLRWFPTAEPYANRPVVGRVVLVRQVYESLRHDKLTRYANAKWDGKRWTTPRGGSFFSFVAITHYAYFNTPNEVRE